ncbi:aabcd3af-7124-47ca-a52f-270d2beee78e [Sclerotinia trifoliorum]|uniref:Aabcd3af-7124-47ca-a52f-270d2beee78e n=1 Tax=Sclerotinia trifoliorum TaxID=28548 RepID=A0A8H2W1E5_9HELO|nr:aabcd3af-7124-47ca-a52f-270d2beee78e [Sclerotinia trifoliorum]
MINQVRAYKTYQTTVIAPLDTKDSSGIRPNVEMDTTLLKNHVILGLRTRAWTWSCQVHGAPHSHWYAER